MTQALISVIVPIYNAETYLEETISSALNQTYKNIEVILVNHSSTDDSVLIIEKYRKIDSRIKVITLDINKGGPAYPRNEGLKISMGEYVAFLDSDDVWLTKRLEKQISIFNNNNNIDIIHSDSYTIDVNSNCTGVFNGQKTYKKTKYFLTDYMSLCVSSYVNINTVLMKKDSNIKFRENLNLIALEDWAFWIDNKFSGKIFYYMDKKLINYRIDINSMSNRMSDASYRKAFYLYSVLFNEYKISLIEYLLLNFTNTIKILVKKLRLKV
jgi:teichuronic acid biosynthesis glycosyltransferase TuaG